jgi:hypothetical protein
VEVVASLRTSSRSHRSAAPEPVPDLPFPTQVGVPHPPHIQKQVSRVTLPWDLVASDDVNNHPQQQQQQQQQT